MKFLLLLFGALMLLIPDARACSCVGKTMEELYDSADKVVLGRVIKLEIEKADYEYQRVTIDILEVFKGNPNTIIFADFDSSMCLGTTFDFGKRHLLFLNEKDHTTGFCGGTTPIFNLESFEKDYLTPLRKLRAANIEM